MELSVVVVVHDMPYAARHTLRALAADHQRDVAAGDYEVLVVDNGSHPPLDRQIVRDLPGTFRWLRLDDASPSPGPAVNRGVAASAGRLVGVIADGARIATPRLLATARRAADSHPRAVVTTVGWLLGRAAPDAPVRADDDATAARTARLLAAANWPADPYRLFEVSRLDGSTHWFGPGTESTALFLRRSLWEELGGMDERYVEPGGGFVCLDLYARALALPAIEPILLLGEGTFHQPHGGVSTDIPPGSRAPLVDAWLARVRALTGRDLPLSTPDLTYLGRMPGPWRAQLGAWAMTEVLEQVPSLAAARHRLEARTPPAERTIWTDLHAVRDLLLGADAAVARAEAEAAQARDQATTLAAAVARLQRTWSWRMTAPLRRVHRLLRRP